MHETLEEEVRRLVASMDEKQNSQERETPKPTEQETEPEETVHIHYFPDAIVILKEGEETPQPDNVIETTLAAPEKPPVFIAYAICLFYLFLIFSCITFQVYEILNLPIATVTIVPKVQTVTLSGALQLGRLLNPITIRQSQTTPATGKGHQDAKEAQGAITFYNGQLNSVTIVAGTILTASIGAQVITEQDAYIPAESQTIPPTLGQTTVSAHAINPGAKGNIPIGNINQGCCAPSIIAQNTAPFHGGQDERNFQTVAKNDIASIASPLKTTVMQSMKGALQEQVKEGEQLFILPCTPTVISDHSIGTEATQVKVTVSETCSAVVYNREALDRKAAALLTRQAATKIGTGYSLFGEVQVSITQANATHTPPLVFLSFHAQGIWVYALSNSEQERIKNLLKGRTKQDAIRILITLPSIEQASIAWGDDTKAAEDYNLYSFSNYYSKSLRIDNAHCSMLFN